MLYEEGRATVRWVAQLLVEERGSERKERDSRRSVDSIRVPWWEEVASAVAGLPVRKAARTNETIPVPAPACTRNAVANSQQSEAVTTSWPFWKSLKQTRRYNT
jgi:hypothetical protein